LEVHRAWAHRFFLGYVLFHKDGDEGFFQGSGIIGSVIALLLYRRFAGTGGRGRRRSRMFS